MTNMAIGNGDQDRHELINKDDVCSKFVPNFMKPTEHIYLKIRYLPKYIFIK